jgi:hypothetical protein
MRARKIVNAILVVLGVVAVLVGVGWAGLQVEPAPFPDYPETSAASVPTTALPSGLPAPVERWYRSAYGERIPQIDSVVVTGRARVRPAGPVWFPARFRFTHDAGRGYRHYIEATWFGIPIIRVNERYVDGVSLTEIMGQTDSGPKVEQAANLGMWAELAQAAPSVLLTDPRVRWEPVDATTAKLVVPLAGSSEPDSFIARFDPATGGLHTLEAPRYHAGNSTATVLWTAQTGAGPAVGPYRMPSTGSATWADFGTWAHFRTEDVRYNVDVSHYLRAPGI